MTYEKSFTLTRVRALSEKADNQKLRNEISIKKYRSHSNPIRWWRQEREGALKGKSFFNLT